MAVMDPRYTTGRAGFGVHWNNLHRHGRCKQLSMKIGGRGAVHVQLTQLKDVESMSGCFQKLSKTIFPQKGCLKDFVLLLSEAYCESWIYAMSFSQLTYSVWGPRHQRRKDFFGRGRRLLPCAHSWSSSCVAAAAHGATHGVSSCYGLRWPRGGTSEPSHRSYALSALDCGASRLHFGARMLRQRNFKLLIAAGGWDLSDLRYMKADLIDLSLMHRQVR